MSMGLYRRFLALLFILIPLTMSGCVTADNIKKANGYYHEGVANLETDRQRAFVSFQKAVQANPNHKEAHYSLGDLYALQRKYKEAEEEFLTAVRIDSNYSEAYNYLGQVYERQDQWPKAIRSYRRALENPLYGTPDLARYNLGVALIHEGEYQDAAQTLEDALLISPATVPAAAIHLELGRVYGKLGFYTQARDALTRVATLDKGGQYAAQAEKLMERLKP
ncbi:MAG: tetratricopeptide repeat protein [Nitrospiraceae bacterium]